MNYPVNIVKGPGAKPTPISAGQCDNTGQLDLQWFPIDFAVIGTNAHADVFVKLDHPVKNLWFLQYTGNNNFPAQLPVPGVFFIHFAALGKPTPGGFLQINGMEPWFNIGHFGRFKSCVAFDYFYWSSQNWGGSEAITLLASDDIELDFSALAR